MRLVFLLCFVFVTSCGLSQDTCSILDLSYNDTLNVYHHNNGLKAYKRGKKYLGRYKSKTWNSCGLLTRKMVYRSGRRKSSYKTKYWRATYDESGQIKEIRKGIMRPCYRMKRTRVISFDEDGKRHKE